MRDDSDVPTPAPDFYFAAMSPYSWLAAERIAQVLPQARWRPVTAAFIFKAAGRTSWGFTAERESGMADCEQRAGAYGQGPIRWPDPWPTNDLTIARAMTFAEEHGALRPLALAAMRMAFREGRDLAEPGVVLEAGERAGIDAAELLAALGDPRVKDALRAATDAAIARGVFGIPTVLVGEDLFWGDDRLQDAAAACVATGA
jgi:2-hydroxychromene-2-carboxylate isomerase